jgi:hypothetical protein
MRGKKRGPDQTIVMSLFRDGFDEGVAEGIRRQRSKLGAPRKAPPELIQELRAELKALLKGKPEPKQENSLAVVQAWPKAAGLGRRYLEPQVVRPVHQELWPKSPRRRRQTRQNG